MISQLINVNLHAIIAKYMDLNLLGFRFDVTPYHPTSDLVLGEPSCEMSTRTRAAHFLCYSAAAARSHTEIPLLPLGQNRF
jgi:hypothetical protein